MCIRDRPYEPAPPPPGPIPVLPPRPSRAGAPAEPVAPDAAGLAAALATPLGTRVTVELSLAGGELMSRVSLEGSPLGARRARLPADVADVWRALQLDPATAQERLTAAGRRLAEAVFDPAPAGRIGGLADTLSPGSRLDLDLVLDDGTVGLPLELLRLMDAAGTDLGPVATRPGVTLTRRLRNLDATGTPASAGPVKLLVAAAAPEETRTASVPLDVEAEMQAVLDAVASLTGQPTAEVQFLEVASAGQIAATVRGEGFHVLHLSAHGSPDGVELEDEDGNPVPTSGRDLVDALRSAGRRVPLIVLSSCAGGSDAAGLAVGLIRRGADRVLAMQAPVSDRYAIELAGAFYAELVREPDQPVAAALAAARYAVEQHRQAARRTAASAGGGGTSAEWPEYGIATLFAAGADLPLVDPALPAEPLTRPLTVPAGGVRDLPLGRLIGPRRELRAATDQPA